MDGGKVSCDCRVSRLSQPLWPSDPCIDTSNESVRKGAKGECEETRRTVRKTRKEYRGLEGRWWKTSACTSRAYKRVVSVHCKTCYRVADFSFFLTATDRCRRLILDYFPRRDMPLSFSFSSPLSLSLSLSLSLARSLALSLFRSLWQKMRDSRGPVHGFLLNFVARERRCPMSEHGEEEARRSVHRAGRNSSFSLGCHLAEKPYENKDVGQFAKKNCNIVRVRILRYSSRHKDDFPACVPPICSRFDFYLF